MLDRAQPIMQRARGRGAVAFRARNGHTHLADLHQSGCVKAMLPNMHGERPEVVFINTSGGITGGDQLVFDAQLGAGTSATLTTQTAERLYRASSGVGSIKTSCEVGEGAELFWLPQETIVFDGAALNRQMEVDLHKDASALLLESFMLGREAMGEVLSSCTISDQWRMRREGKIEFAEAMRINDPLELSSKAALGDNRAFATLVYAAPRAEDLLGTVRSILSTINSHAAASAWPNVLIARFIDKNSFHLRKSLCTVIEEFTKRELPRVWQF